MIEGYYLNQSVYLGSTKAVAARALDKETPLRDTDVVEYLFAEPPPPQDPREGYREMAVFFRMVYGPKHKPGSTGEFATIDVIEDQDSIHRYRKQALMDSLSERRRYFEHLQQQRPDATLPLGDVVALLKQIERETTTLL